MNKVSVFAIIFVAMTMILTSVSTAAPVGFSSNALATSSPLSGAANGNLTIYANGTISNQSLASLNGNTITLLGNISGNLTILEGGIIVDGQGFHVDGTSGIHIENVTNVTLENFGLETGTYSTYLYAEFTHSITVENSSIGSTVANQENLTVTDSDTVTLLNNAILKTVIHISQVGTVTFNDNRVINSISYISSASQATFLGNTLFIGRSSIQVTGVTQVAFVNDSGNPMGGQDAIEVYGAKSVQITNVDMNGTGGAFDLERIGNLSINNSAFNGYSTMYIDYVSNAMIYNLSTTNATGYGLELDNDGNISIVQSAFIDPNGHNSLRAYQLESLYVVGDTFFGAGYIANLETIGNLTVLDSTFNSSWYENYNVLLYFYEIYNGTVSGNTIYCSAYEDIGIYIDAFSYLNVTNNHIFSLNYSQYAIYAEYLTGSTIQNNTISSPSDSYAYGVYLSYTGNVKVLNNKFNGNFSEEVVDEYGVSDRFVGNTAENANWSFDIEYTTSDFISSNVVQSTLYGIYLDHSADTTVLGNYISNVSFYGILLDNSRVNSFYGNVFLGTGSSLSGVFEGNSSSDIFSSNVFTDFYIGTLIAYGENEAYSSNEFQQGHVAMSFASDSGLMLTGNTFAYYDLLFAFYQGVTDIQVYHNNFINYNGTISDANGTILNDIQFDLGSSIGGNYWSNYTAMFSNGIGTSAYYIGAGLQDNYPLETQWTSPSVTFIAAGIAPEESWSVDFNGHEYESSASNIIVPIENATFGPLYYSVNPVAGYYRGSAEGTVFYSGNSITVFVNYTQIKYGVNITAMDMLSGTSLGIEIGNTYYDFTGNLQLNLSNGSYQYTVTAPSDYSIASPSGSFSVNGQNASLNLTFAPKEFLVTFQETGLSGNFTWSITVGGASSNSTTDSVAITFTTGLYNYTVEAPSGYTFVIAGSLTVTGNETVTIAFIANSTLSSSGGFSSSAIAISLIGGGLIGAGAILFIIYLLPGIMSGLSNYRKKE